MKRNHIINILVIVLAACSCRTEKPDYKASGEITFPNASWEPTGLVCAPDGRLLITDISPNAAIQVFDGRGVYLGGIGGPGEEAGYLWVPMDVAVGGDNSIHVAEFGTHRVSVFRADGAFLKTIGDGDLRTPMGVAVGPRGEIYVADPGAGGLVVFNARGEKTALWGRERALADAWDVAVAADGRIAVITADDSGIALLSASGEFKTRATAFGGEWEPVEACYDQAGALYVIGRRKTAAGALEPWVALFDNDGRFREAFAVNLTEPSGIAVDGDGKVYVSDGSRHKVAVYAQEIPGRK